MGSTHLEKRQEAAADAVFTLEGKAARVMGGGAGSAKPLRKSCGPPARVRHICGDLAA